jgi:hypothetical protein
MVQGRTAAQCYNVWHGVLDPSIDQTPPRTGLWWTTEEDNKLKYAMHTHGDKDWVAITALVPGRTKDNVGTDGRRTWALIVVQSREI